MALRRRVKRDLTVIAGVVVILALVVLINYGTGVAKLASKFEAIRTGIEEKRASQGVELLSWKLMRATTGSLRSGGTFVPELIAKEGQTVNFVAFMVPFEQFNHMTEFLVLPLPIECYFCQIPPARDVMFVKMKAGTDTKLYEDPMLFTGTLHLHKEAGAKFFYSIDEATLVPADSSVRPMIKKPKEEHTIPQHQSTGDLEPGYDPLAPEK